MIVRTARQRILRLGTRGSLLARMQSRWMADQLERRHPKLRVELVVCRTTGDQLVDRPLHDIGGKGLFTKELEEALLEKRVDLVVHSMCTRAGDGAQLRLQAAVGGRGGKPLMVCAEARVDFPHAVYALADVLESLNDQQARELLAGLRPRSLLTELT